MIKQKLSQKMLQKLSPQQIQVMKLLQIPTATLDQRIKEELEANPALDEGDSKDELFDLDEDSLSQNKSDDEPKNEKEEYELDDYLTQYLEDDPATYDLKVINSDELNDKNVPYAHENTFHDFLETQLGLLNLNDERKTTIAKQIIGSIDDDGYLRREPIAIIDDLLFSENMEVGEDEVEMLLKKIQQFDPPGVGSRDLQECLLIQIQQIERKEK